jgi:AAA domain
MFAPVATNMEMVADILSSGSAPMKGTSLGESSAKRGSLTCHQGRDISASGTSSFATSRFDVAQRIARGHGRPSVLTSTLEQRQNGLAARRLPKRTHGADDTSGFEKRENVGSEGIGGAAGDAAGADAGDAGNDDKASQLDGLGEWDAGEVTKKPSPREWLLGNVFARRFMSSLLADGGVGKTSVRLLQLISLALGRSLTGEHVFQRCRVLVVSLEDDGEELERRVEATLLHYGIARPELKGWLFLAAPGGTRGKIMTADKRGNTTAGPLKSYIEATIVKRQIDIVSLDPFVKSHKVEENNNSGIDEVVQLLTDMAIKHNIALDAPHHTSKGASDCAFRRS